MNHFPPPWQESAEAACLWPRLQAAQRSLLMLDYDGTLAPFRADRFQAYPYPGVEDRICALAHLPRVRLVLVSGRAAGELGGFFPSRPEIEIWGNHGHERLSKDGSYELLPLDKEQRETLERLKNEMETRGFSRTLEVKPASLAVHWRGFDPAGQEQLGSLVHSLFAQYRAGSRMQLLAFDGGLELRATSHSKGTAVRQILSQEDARVPAAYLGDDLTDEDAFAAIGGRGLSLLVRNEPRESSARFWIKPPEELLDFLDGWLRASIHASGEGARPSIVTEAGPAERTR